MYRTTRAAAALLSLSLTTGLATVAVLTTPRPALAQNATEKRMVDAVVPAVDKTEEAERLFGEKKWAESLAALDAAEKLYDNAFKRFPDAAQKVTFNLTPRLFPTARKYGFIVNEQVAWVMQRYAGKFSNSLLVVPLTGGRVSAGQAQGLTQAMRPVVLAMSGKAFPYNGDGESQPDELDAKDFYEDAFRIASGIEMPVPDDQWEGITVVLNRATLLLDAGRTMNPGLEEKEIGDGRGGQVKGAEGRKMLASLLKEAEKEYAPAATRLASEMPKNVEYGLRDAVASFDLMLEHVNSGAYFGSLTADSLIVKHTEYLAGLRKQYAAYYAKEAKTMPSDVLKPVEDKMRDVLAAVDRKAPTYRFEGKYPAPASIAATVKALVLKLHPGATIAHLAMNDTGWGINRNELGVIVSRSRGGRVSFKKPGEKFHRSDLFLVTEEYGGGGQYGAARPYLYGIIRYESGK